MFKTMCRKTAAFFMALMLVVSYASFNFQPLNVSAAEIVDQPNAFKTTLKDRTTKSDRLTFDIWARDQRGQKLSADTIKVTNNGASVGINWDDSEKTSYTLDLADGENQVEINITGDQVIKEKYLIVKYPANDGELIGDYIMSVDAFTVGLGYIIEPTRMPIYKGQNAAMLLVDQLDKNGFDYKKTGSVNSAFYLSSITKKEGSIYDAGVKIPAEIDALGFGIDPSRHGNSLGEFDFNSMSGWMYKLNNVFPNVGFADSYLQSDDIMTVHFTVGYGSELGGGWGGDSFPAVNRDELIRQIAYINSAGEWKAKFLADPAIKESYNAHLKLVSQFGIKQEDINLAEAKMVKAIANFMEPIISKLPEQVTADNVVEVGEIMDVVYNTTEQEQLGFKDYKKFEQARDRYNNYIELNSVEDILKSFKSVEELSIKK